MLTINHIIILRISDLKRFFDAIEFWRQKEEFIRLVTERTSSIFFDTENERICYSLFYKCLMDKQRMEFKLDDDYLRAPYNGNYIPLRLGRLSEPLKELRKHCSLNILAVPTLMYLMLGANESDSGIEIRYDMIVDYICERRIIPQGDTIFLNKDWNIICSKEIAPLARKIIVNTSQNPIQIQCDEQRVTIQPCECVVGLFSEDRCYKLLSQNIVSDNRGLQMQLKWQNNHAYVIIHTQQGTQQMQDVYSCILEAGDIPVVLTQGGQLQIYHNNEWRPLDNTCFHLNQDYQQFCQNHNPNQLIAIERVNGRTILHACIQ